MSTIDSLVKDSEKLAEALSALESFLNMDNNEAILRIGLLGLMPETNGNQKWKQATDKFWMMFPRGKFPFENMETDVTRSGEYKTISRYARSSHEAQNRYLGPCLALYLTGQIEDEKNVPEKSIIRRTPLVSELCRRIKEFVGTGDKRKLLPSQADLDEENEIIDRYLELKEASNSHSAHNFFFGASNAYSQGGTDDISYYVMYRYSTQRCEIVKTFMVILPPLLNKTSGLTYIHRYQMQTENQKRVTRGAILTYESCMHFMGWARTETRHHTSGGIEYEMGNIRGIKLIALPIGGMNAQHRLISCVFLSHGAAWQPIVGRASMVHIAYKSQLEREISDADVELTLLDKAEYIKDDLKRIYERLGIKKKEADIERAFRYVERAINNLPECDRKRGSEENTLRALTIEEGRPPDD
jgi:tetratricopeptide (TPR) repeat protein